MKRNLPSESAPAVLFVLVGWAQNYDSETNIVGNHKYLRQGNGRDCSEMHLYRLRKGFYSCGIGRGKLKVQRPDIVFVAREPFADCYRIVAVYFNAMCWPTDDNWWWAKASNVILFRGSDRPRMKWIAGQGVRRWAYRAGTSGPEHKDLHRAYKRLLRQHGKQPGGHDRRPR